VVELRTGYDEPYLSVNTEGRLAFFCLRIDGSRLDIWSCNDDRTEFHIMLEPWSPQVINLTVQGVVYTCLGKKSSMLIIKGNHQRTYVADFKTRMMQEITDCIYVAVQVTQ
jgi:hypothetical protein